MKKFQISLAAARVNANMTQEDTAKAMKVSKTTVVNWEKGKVIPRIPEVEMMSRLYKIPQDYIFLPCYSTKSREEKRKEGERDDFKEDLLGIGANKKRTP